MKRDDLMAELNAWLEPDKIADYCPNGLQVEGKEDVHRVLFGVTASEALIDAAIAWKADAVFVHHGYFWKGEPAPLIGAKGRRIRKLLTHGINLIAYHLPLDIHPELGNNAALAQTLDLVVEGQHAAGGVPGLIWSGCLPTPMTAPEIATHLAERLDRQPLLVGGEPGRRYQRIAWCTGGAQGFLGQAASLGVDVYLSGEASEKTYHESLEEGVLYIGAGHHATERYGVQQIAARLAERFGLECEYHELANPI